ncbi:hypothetical protein DFH06DRAFT_1138638 [Mycena polygramma]|nr:hypothetical protein DFH06DRAFT_1138638 [Mycena polygramma]
MLPQAQIGHHDPQNGLASYTSSDVDSAEHVRSNVPSSPIDALDVAVRKAHLLSQRDSETQDHSDAPRRSASAAHSRFRRGSSKRKHGNASLLHPRRRAGLHAGLHAILRQSAAHVPLELAGRAYTGPPRPAHGAIPMQRSRCRSRCARPRGRASPAPGRAARCIRCCSSRIVLPVLDFPSRRARASSPRLDRVSELVDDLASRYLRNSVPSARHGPEHSAAAATRHRRGHHARASQDLLAFTAFTAACSCSRSKPRRTTMSGCLACRAGRGRAS